MIVYSFSAEQGAQRIERLYCKRPIQCLASSKILTHSRGDTLAGEGGGGQYSEEARHSSVLYICKYFVGLSVPGKMRRCANSEDFIYGQKPFSSIFDLRVL